MENKIGNMLFKKKRYLPNLISEKKAKKVYDEVMSEVEIWRNDLAHWRKCQQMGHIEFAEKKLNVRVKSDRYYKGCCVSFKESHRRKGGYFNYIDYNYENVYVIYDGSYIYVYSNIDGSFVSKKMMTGKYLEVEFGNQITKAGFNRAISIKRNKVLAEQKEKEERIEKEIEFERKAFEKRVDECVDIIVKPNQKRIWEYWTKKKKEGDMNGTHPSSTQSARRIAYRFHKQWNVGADVLKHAIKKGIRGEAPNLPTNDIVRTQKRNVNV